MENHGGCLFSLSLSLSHTHTHTLTFSLTGLGRKKGRDEDWIEHQDAFDQILADLNAQTVTSNMYECSNHTEDSSPLTGKALLETATESKRLLYDILD